MNGRFFPANWRPARQEIAFAQASNFAAMQFAVRDGHWTEERLGDSFGVIHEALHAAGLTAVMEIVVFINAQGHTRQGLTPLAVLQANLPAIQGLHCYAAHWHLAPAEFMDAATVIRLERSLLPQFERAVDHVRMIVKIETSQREEAVQLAKEIGRELRQKAMFVEVVEKDGIQILDIE